MDEIVEKLKELGFNEYQSKVYIALLKKFPATGYEISKLANIPQSRTYDTLKNLETLNIVLSSNSKPVTYTPIRPKELTKRYKRKFDSTINFLEKNSLILRKKIILNRFWLSMAEPKLLTKLLK